jgi:hypothetical protein
VGPVRAGNGGGGKIVVMVLIAWVDPEKERP